MKKVPLTVKVLHLALAVMLLTFSLPRTVFSQALTTTTNEFVPFVARRFVPCANGGAGEFVLVSGTAHMQSHQTTTQNRVITNFISSQPQGMTGVGEITGDVYHFVGTTRVSQSVQLTGGASTLTFINNLSFIGRGPDNNLLIHQNIHLTVNANGEVSTWVRHSNIECF